MPGSDILIERSQMIVEGLDELVAPPIEQWRDGAPKSVPVEIVPPKLNRHQRRALAVRLRAEARQRKKAQKGGKA